MYMQHILYILAWSVIIDQLNHCLDIACLYKSLYQVLWTLIFYSFINITADFNAALVEFSYFKTLMTVLIIKIRLCDF